jgi:general secretion pathway protein J
VNSNSRPFLIFNHQNGFTLVELLVALMILAIMAALSWQGLDVMLKSKEITQSRIDEVGAIQNILAQWEADLSAVLPVATNGGGVPLPSQPTANTSDNLGQSSSPSNPGLATPRPTISLAQIQAPSKVLSVDWDGQVFKLIRRSSTPSPLGIDSGVNVVAWTIRDHTWYRWQSSDITQISDLFNAWSQASLWAHNPSSESKQFEASLMPCGGWKLYYFRENAWSNALSSSGVSSSSSNPSSALSSVPDAIRLELQLAPSLGGSLVIDWVRPAFSINRS